MSDLSATSSELEEGSEDASFQVSDSNDDENDDNSLLDDETVDDSDLIQTRRKRNQKSQRRSNIERTIEESTEQRKCFSI